jgi:RimJ/RimL family protein N-acetyltransferase
MLGTTSPRSGGIDIALVPEARGKGAGGDAVAALARHLGDDRKWSRVMLELPLRD